MWDESEEGGEEEKSGEEISIIGVSAELMEEGEVEKYKNKGKIK